MSDYIDIVLDGPPGPVSGRFVEVEDGSGASISIGEWVQRDDGCWALRLSTPDIITDLRGQLDRVRAVLEKIATGHVTGEPVHPADASRIRMNIAKETLREIDTGEIRE